MDSCTWVVIGLESQTLSARVNLLIVTNFSRACNGSKDLYFMPQVKSA